MPSLLTLTLLAAFRFHTPEGWTNLSRCPDEKTLAALPEDVANDAQRMCGAGEDGGVKTKAALAVDLRHVEDRAVATFNAVVVNGAPVIDDAAAQKMGEGMVDVAARKGEKLELIDAKAAQLSGQKGAQLRFLRTYRSDRMDVFVVPHEANTAMLTFIAPIARYEEYQPVFAAIANDVIGVPESPEERFTPPLKILAFVSVAAGAALGYYLLVRRRQPGKT